MLPILAFCCGFCYSSFHSTASCLTHSLKKVPDKRYVQKGKQGMKSYMKRSTVIAILFLLVAVAFSACASVVPGSQMPDLSDAAENDVSTERADDPHTELPAFLNDIGKTLCELKEEHPEGECIVRPDGFPDHAAVCFGTPEEESLYCFFGAQSGDAEKAMSEREDQLRCAGFLTTADALFPDMEEDLSFEEFFTLIGVDDYEYFGQEEDTITAQGWLSFTYCGMEVMVNTNEAIPDGGWDFTGAEIVKCNAPVSIIDAEKFKANQDLADAVMFG